MPAKLPIPDLGAPLPTVSSAEMLDRLATRRSASAPLLAAPGPDDAQLRDLLQIAARAPDHGKLFPWRFIVLRDGSKAAFVEALRRLADHQPDADKARTALRKLEEARKNQADQRISGHRLEKDADDNRRVGESQSDQK